MLLCRTKTDIASPYFFPLLVPKFPQTTTPQAEEEHKILENYLMEMRIEDGQLKFPPISKLLFGAYGDTFVGLNDFYYTSLHRKAADSGLEADVLVLS